MDLAEMFRHLGEKVRIQAREPNVLAYVPHAKQLLFHSSSAKIRLYIGGNRSGKTVGGITEDIFYMKGEHPYKRIFEPPTRGRILSTDFTYGINQVIIPKLRQWLPPSMLTNGNWDDSYSNEFKLLTLANGSTVELMTYEQNPDKFQGTSRHWTHYDEEPPHPIYKECQARLIDTYGDCWLTMTPVEGMSWVYDSIYLKGTEEKHPNIFVVVIDIHENPYLSVEAIDAYLETLDDDPEERKAREKGLFVQLGGKVYKKFNQEEHVIPALEPAEIKALLKFDWYRSMDHGYNNPTAWYWHAVKPDGSVITFAEHYAREMTVEEHAKIVLAMDAEFGKEPEFCVGDPATQQRQGVTGTSIAVEYAKYGIYIAPGNNDVLTGVGKVQQYLKYNPKTLRPYWQITDNCPNLTKEMARLRWKTYSSKKAQSENNPQEQIHKHNDHGCDATRYFFASQPDLETTLDSPVAKLPVSTAVQSYDQLLAKMYLGDDTVPFSDEQKTQWAFNINPMEWDF
jgi:phage terminase large subunit-like protein